MHAARKQDRRLAVALLAAAVSHTPEGEEVLRGARMRMARKPSAIARELLRNFPRAGKRRRKRGKRRPDENGEDGAPTAALEAAVASQAQGTEETDGNGAAPSTRSGAEMDLAGGEDEALTLAGDDEEPAAAVDAQGDA